MRKLNIFASGYLMNFQSAKRPESQNLKISLCVVEPLHVHCWLLAGILSSSLYCAQHGFPKDKWQENYNQD